MNKEKYTIQQFKDDLLVWEREDLEPSPLIKKYFDYYWNSALKEAIDKISKDVNVMVACKEDIKPAQIIELTIKEIRGLLK